LTLSLTHAKRKRPIGNMTDTIIIGGSCSGIGTSLLAISFVLYLGSKYTTIPHPMVNTRDQADIGFEDDGWIAKVNIVPSQVRGLRVRYTGRAAGPAGR
jgi:hypothetical protein